MSTQCKHFLNICLKLLFHFPICRTICRKLASPSKIMGISCYQINCGSASGIKMSRVAFSVCIDCNQHAFIFTFSFKNTLSYAHITHPLAVITIFCVNYTTYIQDKKYDIEPITKNQHCNIYIFIRT